MAAGRVLVYGGRGALGRSIVTAFKVGDPRYDPTLFCHEVKGQYV